MGKPTKQARLVKASPPEILVSSKRRRDIALEATYQMAAIFGELATQTRSMDCADTCDESAVVKALLIRGSVLASAAMVVLDDDTVPASSADETEDSFENLEKVVMMG